MHITQATAIAGDLLERLYPHCEKLAIAGSVRRGKPDVGDIEIVCLPKKLILKDLFGWDEGVVVDHKFCDLVKSLGTIEIGKTDGRYMRILLPQGIKLDLFMPQPDDFWRIMAIRTGSSEYSSTVLATAWKKLGWCGVSPHGLRRIHDCEEIKHEGKASTWKLVNPDGDRPPVWQSEEELFAWLQLPWVEPKYREIN